MRLLSALVLVGTLAGLVLAESRTAGPLVLKANDPKLRSKFTVKQGEPMEVHVKGKWRMSEKLDYTGALGHAQGKKLNVLGNHGALIIQVGVGKPFAWEDDKPFIAPASGEVYFWANRPSPALLKADGELTITIRAGTGEPAVKQDAPPGQDEVQKAMTILNQARKAAGLPEVKLSAELSLGCRNHSRYLVVNKGNPKIAGLKAHEESKDLKEYSEAGAKAAKASVIHFVPPSAAIHGWLASFYHRVPLLQPGLTEVGVGFHNEGTDWACCIDCITGTKNGQNNQPVVYYPADGQIDVPLEFGGEIPDPLPAGHKGPAGFPLTITFTQQQNIRMVEFKLRDSQQADVPVYLSTPEKPATSWEQWNSVCVFPQKPLAKGKTYEAELTCLMDRKPYKQTWKFTTEK